MLEHLPLLRQIHKEWTLDQYCDGHFAIDSVGVGCYVDAPEAVAWCIQGKAMHLLGIWNPRTFWAHPLRDYLNGVAARAFGIGPAESRDAITIVNNWHGWHAAIAVLDICISELEAQVAEGGEESSGR